MITISGSFMEYFKSKFLYIVFIARILLIFALIGVSGLFVLIGIPNIWNKNVHLIAILLIALGVFIFSYLLLMLGFAIWQHRFILIVRNGEVFLKDIILNRFEVTGDNIMGYSTSKYGNRGAYNGPISDFKTLLIYFKDGRVIEFPQFLYANFKLIPEILNASGIKYLGNEPFKWKNLISRKYYFK